jgi:hypothetical protein
MTPMNHIALQTMDGWPWTLLPLAANHEPCHASETEMIIESGIRNFTGKQSSGSAARCQKPVKKNQESGACQKKVGIREIR